MTMNNFGAKQKFDLVPGCARLNHKFDPAPILAEVNALDDAVWSQTQRRRAVHGGASSIFLRGYPPLEGAKPIEDRELLGQLPAIRSLIYSVIPAAPMRCVLAKLHAGKHISRHMDKGPYFEAHLRLHFPIYTNPGVQFCANSLFYRMAEGEVWVLNNSNLHGVLNENTEDFRLHIICDFVPNEALIDAIKSANTGLGVVDDEALQRLDAYSNQSFEKEKLEKEG